MDVGDVLRQNCECDNFEKELLKPLERRKKRHQRCMAHSLVGTPDYIAPEVLQREGMYTQLHQRSHARVRHVIVF